MNIVLARTFTAGLLLALAAGPSASAADPSTAGALRVPANRIVGVWHVQGLAGPCANPAVRFPINGMLVFNAGGTLTMVGLDNPAASGPGLGTWSYDPRTGRYTKQFRFAWFNSGVYIGYQKVGPIEFVLSADGATAANPVRSERWVYDPNTGTHSKAFDVCGEEVAVRLY
ncbi:hypothetical protein [Vulcaniibacterium gelatinicum]|jgi:hypothetical protein|uniref:hypothetical protein n=1 Tax=Vulcaniibacterium gelatinicum TaxID=2598725 RepID=UPI0011C8A708|nr:hypothetical protein [Vulcaniibacterium gelatinicum]